MFITQVYTALLIVLTIQELSRSTALNQTKGNHNLHAAWAINLTTR